MLVVIGKPQLANREDSILKNNALLFLDYQKSISRNGKNSSLILLKSGKRLIATLMEDMEPVVKEKDDFCCRYKSKTLAHFGIIGLPRFSWKRKNQGFNLSIGIKKFQAFTKHYDGKYEASICEELLVSNSR